MTQVLKVMRDDWAYLRRHGLRMRAIMPVLVWACGVVVLWGLVTCM